MAAWRGHALLLCYPPPRSRMALECARQFCGATLVHVGEWLGDTGNLAFERELFSHWELVRRVPLPLWGDTADDLTVWRRRAVPLPEAASEHPLVVCGACGAPARLEAPTSAMSSAATHCKPKRKREGVQLPLATLLRRCRYCRLAAYCSEACANADAVAHERCHLAKCITISRPLDFYGRDYYDLRKPYIS